MIYTTERASSIFAPFSIFEEVYCTTQSGPTLKVEARSRHEVDYHHVLIYGMGSKEFSTDRSTEQLASAATYFGAIVIKIREHEQQLAQHQQSPLMKDRDQGLEL